MQEKLGRDEAAVLKTKGRTALHKTSATSFLAMGLELEESQYVYVDCCCPRILTDSTYRRRLKVLAAEHERIPKSLQTSALRDQRKILKDKIQNWEAVRTVYAPGLLQIQTDLGLNPTAIWNSNPNPEDVDLCLPSSISSNVRYAACIEGLPEIELQLRTAQCSSSLEGLRQALRVKTRMVYFKNKNIRGQREGTRSRAIIDRVHERAIRFVQKYRVARLAKLSLEGPGKWEKMYRELHNDDIRGFASAKPKSKLPRRGIWEDGHAPTNPDPPETSSDDDIESDPDLNDGTEAGPPTKKKCKAGTGETRKVISWIWKNVPLSLDNGEDDDIMRAEWARSRARVRRVTEEVALVQEEMRRVGEFIDWKARWWESRATLRSQAGLELMDGLTAYAAKQASVQKMLSTTFKALWKTPLSNIEKVLQQLDSQSPDGDNPSSSHDRGDNDAENSDDDEDNDSDGEGDTAGDMD